MAERILIGTGPIIAILSESLRIGWPATCQCRLAHLAERENIRSVFTTDRQTSIIRLKRNRSLKLIPNI